jgi:uncharacterized protein (TIGR03086 family)
MTDNGDSEASGSVKELIALGRDREAIDAATRDLRQGGAMDGVQQLDKIIPILESVVDNIDADQFDNATPCAKFTVSSVLEHMVTGATAFAPAFRGDGRPAETPAGTLVEQWRNAVGDLLAAVHTAGAQERTIAAPFGEVPGSVFARFVAFDGLVHGWDLAVATGQAYDPPAGLVAEVEGFARQAVGDELRDGDTFAAATEPPADATPIERLAAFSGRTVPARETSR